MGVDITEVIENVLPEVIIAVLEVLCGLMYSFIKKAKKDLSHSRTINSLLLRGRLNDEHIRWSNLGYCSIEMLNYCTAVYEEYKYLGGNGGADKVLEELKKLPTNSQKRR